MQVVDKNGSVVGAVGQASAGDATIFLQISGELFALDVNASGFSTSSGYYGNRAAFSVEDFLYASPDCTGTRYSGRYYGGVATPSPTEFAHPVAVDSTGTAYFTRPTELKNQQYYAINEIPNSSTATATQNCTTPPSDCVGVPGGKALGAEHPCRGNPTSTCVSCCQPDTSSPGTPGSSCVLNSGEQEAPVHPLDLSTLGKPPFHLQL
jgi:hypothetical protein